MTFLTPFGVTTKPYTVGPLRAGEQREGGGLQRGAVEQARPQLPRPQAGERAAGVRPVGRALAGQVGQQVHALAARRLALRQRRRRAKVQPECAAHLARARGMRRGELRCGLVGRCEVR